MKRYLLPAVVVSLFLSAPVNAEDTIIKTYILAGQSNANGFGLGYGGLYSGVLSPNKNLHQIGRSDLVASQSPAYIFKGSDNSGMGEWKTMAPGFGMWNGIRFGPELSFSKKLQSANSQKLALIKYSPNGTSLYKDWNPNLSTINRYDYFIRAVNNAKTAAAARGWSLDIRGVLWMQGEGDTFGVDAPAAYERNLGNFITKVRAALRLPNLKFHIGQIADSEAWPSRQKIWNAQQSVAAGDSHAYLVNGKDLPLFTNDSLGLNNIHYTTTGTVLLGERFAASVTNAEVVSAYPVSNPDSATTSANKPVTIDVLDCSGFAKCA